MSKFELKGNNNRDLRDDWKDHAEAYYGVSASGYPNFWLLIGPNTGLGHNSIIFMIEAQANYILKCMELLKNTHSSAMNLKPDAQRYFNEDLQQHFKGTVWSTGCQSWYQQEGGRNIAVWPKSTWKYWLETLKVKTTDYELYPSIQNTAINSSVVDTSTA